MAPKDEQLRPLMTRLPERLRRRLERAASANQRSMNAEIIYRLEQSFEVSEQAAAVADAVRTAGYAAAVGLSGDATMRLARIEQMLTEALTHTPPASSEEDE